MNLRLGKTGDGSLPPVANGAAPVAKKGIPGGPTPGDGGQVAGVAKQAIAGTEKDASVAEPITAGKVTSGVPDCAKKVNGIAVG